MQTIEIAKLKIPNRYTPAEYFETLKASIAEKGVINPILISVTGRVIDGVARVRAAKALGHTEIPADKF